MRCVQKKSAIAAALLLAVAAGPGRALDLGGTDVPKDRIVVYLFIGHSNVLSDDSGEVIHQRAWNYIIPGALGRPEGWVLARNPLHVSFWGPLFFCGPGKPFLQKMAAEFPGYHIGMLQNPNNRATVTWIDPSPGEHIDPIANRYCKSCPSPHPGPGGLYDEIIDHAMSLESHVTLGGVVVMLGFMEAKQAGPAGRFADDVVQMITDMRADLGMPDLPLLIGQGCFEGPNKGDYWQTVRAQILSIPSRTHRAAVVDPILTHEDDYSDDHHYNDAGHAKWAQRAVQIIKDNGWFPLAEEPSLSVYPDKLEFSGETGGADPAPKTVGVANAGTGVLNSVDTEISYQSGTGWLAVAPGGAGNAQSLENQVHLAGLPAGAYQAQVKVSCANALNSPKTYTVDLHVDETLTVSDIVVTPDQRVVYQGGSATFKAEAFDQHGQPIAASIAWSVDGGGSLDPPACSLPAVQCQTTFEAGDTAGTFTLTASAGPVQGSASVHVLPPPVIHLLGPTGGETWRAGETHHIDWTTENLDMVKILYFDGAQWKSIEVTIGNSDPRWGHYPWVVPDTPTTAARIRIAGYLDQAPVESGPFTIESSGGHWLHLRAPTGGEEFVAGEETSIQWESDGLSAVRLFYSLDAGYNWEPIAIVSHDDTQWADFAWTLPAAASEYCLVRAQSSDGSIEDSSERFFLHPPEGAPAGPFQVVQLSLGGLAPKDLGSAESIAVGGVTVPVVDGAFEAAVDVPAGIRTMVFELRAINNAGEVVSRLARLDVEDAGPPIDGLDVSAQELRTFLGGRDGILVWVDASDGGRLKALDFGAADPVVRKVGSHTNVINPRISPDGTRVVYSVGSPAAEKDIFIARLSDGEAAWIASGDVGYWQDEDIVYCDWSDADQDGADGNTYRQGLAPDGLSPEGAPTTLHDRAMDAGPNGDGIWLGQVYEHLYAYNTQSSTEYGPTDFRLLDDSPATGQVCNGSMAPDGIGRLMTLVIPHDWVRIFTHDPQADVFVETSRFELPAGQMEWEYPEWSTHPDYFTAVLQPGTLLFSLHIVRIEPGDLAPEVLRITPKGSNVSYSHLWVQP
jgi:hypothetical protein